MPDFTSLSLQDLADHYGILSKTPSYSEVEGARKRLAVLREDKKEYDRMEGDYAEVLQYADMLERNGQAVGQALCLAQSLVPFSPSTDPAQKLRDALSALAAGLRLVGSGEEYTRGEIARCFQEAFGADLAIPAVSRGLEHLDAWLVQFLGTRGAANRIPTPNAIEVRRNAWATWETRLVSFLQKETQAPAVLADMNYLRCLTEKSAAATVLPINLTEATVARWSDAVIAAAQQQRGEPAPEYCPVWIAACSLRALGFDMTYVWEQITLWTPSESEAMGRLMPTLAQSKSTVAPGLLVLRTAVSTITTTWRPADGIACLAIEASTAETIFGKGRLSLLNYLPGRISGVLLEVNNADDIAKARASLDTLPGDFRTKPVAVAWPDKSPPTTTAMSGLRLVIAPSDPVDAWSKGFVTAGSAPTPVQS